MSMIVERGVETEKKSPRRGGAFLIEAIDASEIVTPEDFPTETVEIAAAVESFVRAEVMPHLEPLEHGDLSLLSRILKQCGALGFFQLEVPEAYGGLDLDKTTATRAAEMLSPAGGFAVAFGAHSSIGMLPLVYFGSETLRNKYLTRVASGELIAAYCLSEPGSGSDALAAKTRATLNADGTYTLSGTKMWISNGGIADLFTVFCQVITPDGPKFSAFMVERGFAGVVVGREEQKMGIKMSSTTAITFDDVVVPAENLLGEVGQGAKIAFNILNIGRYKLGAAGVGGSKQVLALSANYAKGRHAFGRAISSFGAIREKLAEMALRTFVAEAAVYRVTGLIDAYVAQAEGAVEGMGSEAAGEKSPNYAARLAALQAYRVEASIVKVLGSEVLDYCTDEAVQIHGGYGYSQEYAVERAYRDARINRIFEGTNEINRLLIPGELLKMALKNELPLLGAAEKLQGELLELSFDEIEDTPLAEEFQVVANLKRVAILVAAQAATHFTAALIREQEILMRVADVVITAFSAESALLRAKKAFARGDARAELMAKMARIYTHDAAEQTSRWAREAMESFQEGDELRLSLAAIKRLTKRPNLNVVALRREIAASVLESEAYPI